MKNTEPCVSYLHWSCLETGMGSQDPAAWGFVFPCRYRFIMNIVKATQAAQLMAVGAQTKIAKLHPEFYKALNDSGISSTQWDFLFTVGIIGQLLMAKQRSVDELKGYEAELKAFNPSLANALDKFFQYFDQLDSNNDLQQFRLLLGNFVMASNNTEHQSLSISIGTLIGVYAGELLEF